MRSPITVKYNPDWRKRPSPTPVETTGFTSPTPVEKSTTESGPVQQITTIKEPLSASKGSTVGEVNTTTVAKAPTTPWAKMPITWDSHRKLAKKGVAPVAVPPAPPATNPEYPPTPETTPERKPSMFSRFGSKPKGKQVHYNTSGALPSPTSPQVEDDEPVWKHHESYFPEYTPIYPTTTFTDPCAKAYLLTPAEIQAQQHAADVGHAVAVHYPMLPPFGDYSATKGQGAWQSGQWGNSNWTGFGLSGEKLPDSDGNTFGAPMPKGIPNPEPGAKGKGGGGGGEGGASKAEEGGGGGGGGGDASGGGGGGGEGGAGGAGGGGGGGGGGGKKGKGKK